MGPGGVQPLGRTDPTSPRLRHNGDHQSRLGSPHAPTGSRHGHQATQRSTQGLGLSTPRHHMPGPIRTITPGPDTHPHHTGRPRGPGRLPPNGEDTHGNPPCASMEGQKPRPRPRPPNGPHDTEQKEKTTHPSPARARTATPSPSSPVRPPRRAHTDLLQIITEEGDPDRNSIPQEGPYVSLVPTTSP
jgi:hypothetical protein